ncbi:MAG: transglutaminase family protein, partial [Halobacteriaceae archaeon]
MVRNFSSPTAAIEKKAEAILEDARGQQPPQCLFLWVRDHFQYDIVPVRGAEDLVVHDRERAMSFDKSNLLAALLRTQDISCRFRLMVCQFHNTYAGRHDRAIHAPIEAKIQGKWMTLDPAFGQDTSAFRSPTAFGEEPWESVSWETRRDTLPRWLIGGYNHVFRRVH